MGPQNTVIFWLCIVAAVTSMEFVNVPGLSPLQSPVVVDGAIDTPRDTAEPPKVGDDRERDDGEEDVLGALRE